MSTILADPTRDDVATVVKTNKHVPYDVIINNLPYFPPANLVSSTLAALKNLWPVLRHSSPVPAATAGPTGPGLPGAATSTTSGKETAKAKTSPDMTPASKEKDKDKNLLKRERRPDSAGGPAPGGKTPKAAQNEGQTGGMFVLEAASTYLPDLLRGVEEMRKTGALGDVRKIAVHIMPRTEKSGVEVARAVVVLEKGAPGEKKQVPDDWLRPWAAEPSKGPVPAASSPSSAGAVLGGPAGAVLSGPAGAEPSEPASAPAPAPRKPVAEPTEIPEAPTPPPRVVAVPAAGESAGPAKEKTKKAPAEEARGEKGVEKKAPEEKSGDKKREGKTKNAPGEKSVGSESAPATPPRLAGFPRRPPSPMATA